jgi:hypothetical protein
MYWYCPDIFILNKLFILSLPINYKQVSMRISMNHYLWCLNKKREISYKFCVLLILYVHFTIFLIAKRSRLRYVFCYKHSEEESPLNDTSSVLDNQKSNLSESTPEEGADTKGKHWFSRVCKVSCDLWDIQSQFHFSSITVFHKELMNVMDIR